MANRARIVAPAADSLKNTAIAQQVGASRPTMIGWRERYQSGGIDGLHDEPRTSLPRVLDHREIVAARMKPRRRSSG